LKPVRFQEFAAESERVGRVNRGYPADFLPSSIRWSEIGGNPDYVSATTAHPNVMRMVQALLGGPIKRPHRTRGQYVHFPTGESETFTDSSLRFPHFPHEERRFTKTGSGQT
jgi:hypothetical protein